MGRMQSTGTLAMASKQESSTSPVSSPLRDFTIQWRMQSTGTAATSPRGNMRSLSSLQAENYRLEQELRRAMVSKQDRNTSPHSGPPRDTLSPSRMQSTRTLTMSPRGNMRSLSPQTNSQFLVPQMKSMSSVSGPGHTVAIS